MATDPVDADLRDWVSTHSPFTPDAAAGIHTLFSPRHGLAPLGWYAKEFGTGD